jgi:imidazolonepropionase-like amidohydrolase
MACSLARAAVILAAICVVSLSGTAGAAQSLLIRNADLIDGTGAPRQQHVSILIRDGRVRAIGPDVSATDVATLDAGGETVIPGLIDAHVHLMEVPGAEVRHDPPDRLTALRHAQLRSYLACGVTTVLDAATKLSIAQELKAWRTAGHAGPTVLTLGPPIAARGGYMSGMNPELTVASIDDLDRVFDAAAGVGAIGVKVPIEAGFGGRSYFAIHPPPVRAAIVRKAAERGLPIYVHASDESEQTIGLDMQAHALMHTNFNGADPSPEFVARVVQTGTYMVTTFSIIDAGLARWHPERLDDRLVRIAVPETERDTALSAGAWAERDGSELAYAYPRLPGFLIRWLARRSPPQEEPEQTALAANLRAAGQLHAAGAWLVIGSDAGNSSLLSEFHGTSTLRELELLAQAGVPAGDVLAAATRVAAQMLGIAGDVGTIEPGKRADLVVLAEDPTDNIKAIRTIRFTVKDGIAHTPAEWMNQP